MLLVTEADPRLTPAVLRDSPTAREMLQIIDETYGECCQMFANLLAFGSNLRKPGGKNALVIRATFLYVIVKAKNSEYYKCKLIACRILPLAVEILQHLFK